MLSNFVSDLFVWYFWRKLIDFLLQSLQLFDNETIRKPSDATSG